jgi:hypothetical protein
LDPVRLRECKIGVDGGLDVVDKECFVKCFISETRDEILPANNHAEVNYSIPLDTALHKIEMLLYTRSGYCVQRTVFQNQNGKVLQSSFSYRMVKNKAEAFSKVNKLKTSNKDWIVFLTPGYTKK